MFASGDEQHNPESERQVRWTRREFLKMSGLLAAGVAAGSVFKLWGADGGAFPGNISSTVSHNKAIVRTMLEAYNTGNTRIVDELLHARLSSRLASSRTSGGTMPYGQLLKREIANARAAFPNARFVEEEMIAERDTVILRWRMTGAHKTAAHRAPASVVGHEVFRLEGGKIVEHIAGLADSHLVMLSRVGLFDQVLARKLS